MFLSRNLAITDAQGFEAARRAAKPQLWGTNMQAVYRWYGAIIPIPSILSNRRQRLAVQAARWQHRPDDGSQAAATPTGTETPSARNTRTTSASGKPITPA